VLVFALAHVLRRERTLAAAALGIAVLIGSQLFMRLSSSLLIGIPAIACACLSISALSRWCRRQHVGWAATAGALLGISLSIKLFTAFLIPIVAVWLVIQGKGSAIGYRRPLLAWSLALVGVIGGVLLSIGELVPALDQLVGTHMNARASFDWRTGIKVVPNMIREDAPLFLLALIGLVASLRKTPQRPSVLPLYGAWLVVGSLVLLAHRPVWSHHILLMTVPAAVLAGAAWRKAMGWPLRGVVLTLLVLVGFQASHENRLWRIPRWNDHWEMVAEMARHRAESRWVIVGTPLFAAHLDLPTPPELAVSSKKRFRTGGLTASTIVDVIERDRPEQILLTRDWPQPVRDSVRDTLVLDYGRTAWNPGLGFELFLRRDLLPLQASSLMWRSDAWFTSEDGLRTMDHLMSWQSPLGGWAKGYDAASPHEPGQFIGEWEGHGTFDNGATCAEIRLLARAFRLSGRSVVRQGVERGLDFVIGAAYPNGGWPQRFPPPSDYGRAITFNDEVMVNVLELLRAVSSDEDFAFLDSDRRARVQAAYQAGLQCLLRCQIRVGDTLTGWAQQYDPVSLEPVGGRSYEPRAIASRESARVLDFLLTLDQPTAASRRAIHAAAAWLKASEITGRRLERTSEDVVLVDDPDAPPLWARFYEISTNRPIYCNRDGKCVDALADIKLERRVDYEWLGRWGSPVLSRYRQWVESHDSEGGG
jgi:pectate lyase